MQRYCVFILFYILTYFPSFVDKFFITPLASKSFYTTKQKALISQSFYLSYQCVVQICIVR